MTAPLLTYEMRGAVAFLRFHDPAHLNALSPEMCAALGTALTRAEQEARALVLGSHGRAFCAGANLTNVPINLADPARDAGLFLEETLNPLILHIRALSIPMVTAVRGAAAGAGVALALAGDMVVAGQSAYFYQAFCHLGLVPDAGCSHMLVQTLGRVRAAELMLLGEKLSAAQALDWGLINRLVADEEVDALALDLAARLADGPKALGMIRQLTWSATDNDLPTQLQLEREMQKHASRTKDFVEGVTAFLEKRAPQFKNE